MRMRVRTPALTQAGSVQALATDTCPGCGPAGPLARGTLGAHCDRLGGPAVSPRGQRCGDVQSPTASRIMYGVPRLPRAAVHVRSPTHRSDSASKDAESLKRAAVGCPPRLAVPRLPCTAVRVRETRSGSDSSRFVKEGRARPYQPHPQTSSPRTQGEHPCSPGRNDSEIAAGPSAPRNDGAAHPGSCIGYRQISRQILKVGAPLSENQL